MCAELIIHDSVSLTDRKGTTEQKNERERESERACERERERRMGCTQTKLKELEGGSFKVQHQTKSYVHRKSVKQAACNMPGQLHESMLLLHSTSDDKNGGQWRDEVKIEQKYSIEGSAVLGEGLCGKVRVSSRLVSSLSLSLLSL